MSVWLTVWLCVVGTPSWRPRRGLAGRVNHGKALNTCSSPSTSTSTSTRWDAPRSSSKTQNRYLINNIHSAALNQLWISAIHETFKPDLISLKIFIAATFCSEWQKRPNSWDFFFVSAITVNALTLLFSHPACKRFTLAFFECLLFRYRL